VSGACAEQAQSPVDEQSRRESVRTALIAMVSQVRDPFVIVQEAQTRKYIQFYNEEGQILIDLPEIALSEDEARRAGEYFSRHGIPFVVVENEIESGAESTLESWQRVYPAGEMDAVLDVAFGAMVEVYGFDSNVELEVIRGWEGAD
jgi:hypothetical protein